MNDASDITTRAGATAASYREGWIGMSDGLRLYYREYGDPLSTGTPVLCLSGLARNAKDFDDLARALAPSRRVICPDYIGRGRSEYATDWQRYYPQAMVGDVLALMTALNLHGSVLIGTSLGGFLTMGVAALAPTRVRAAVLNDVGPDFGDSALDRIIDYIGNDHPEPDMASAIANLKLGFPQLGFEEERDWIDMANGTFQRADDGVLHIDWDKNLARTLLDRRDGFDLWALFGALSPRPVLAFRGANSDALLPETFQKMAEKMPEIQAITVPNRAHTPTLREPECRKSIIDFIKRVDDAPV